MSRRSSFQSNPLNVKAVLGDSSDTLKVVVDNLDSINAVAASLVTPIEGVPSILVVNDFPEEGIENTLYVKLV